MASPIFTWAVDAITRDPTWAESALYTAPPAPPVAVTVYREREDEAVEFGGIGLQAPGWKLHVRQSEVPERPRPGVDTFTIGAEVLHVRSVEEDSERTSWILGTA